MFGTYESFDEFLISALLAKALYFSTYIYNKKVSKPTQKYRVMPQMGLHPSVCKNKELEDLKYEIEATKLLCFCLFSFRTQPIKLTSMFLFFLFSFFILWQNINVKLQVYIFLLSCVCVGGSETRSFLDGWLVKSQSLAIDKCFVGTWS